METASRGLVDAALDDREAFAAIVDRHKAMVYSIAWHFFRNRSVSEDLAQDVFLELFRNLGRIESDAHLLFWLRRAMTRKCIDQARWLANRPQTPLEAAPEARLEAKTGDVFASEALRKCVAALPERRRLILILRFQEGLELGEIAEAIAAPVNTVKSTLHRTLALLREKLAAWEGANLYGTAGR